MAIEWNCLLYLFNKMCFLLFLSEPAQLKSHKLCAQGCYPTISVSNCSTANHLKHSGIRKPILLCSWILQIKSSGRTHSEPLLHNVWVAAMAGGWNHLEAFLLTYCLLDFADNSKAGFGKGLECPHMALQERKTSSSLFLQVEWLGTLQIKLTKYRLTRKNKQIY